MTSNRAIAALITILAALVCASSCHRAAGDASSTTFDGTTLRIIVGFRAGGPYDVHARILARHLGRYLPGHPGVVVENMPGANGGVAQKHLATQAKADGLTLGLLSETSASDVIAKNLPATFDILGSPGPPPQLIFFSARSGISSVEAWRHASRPPRFGSGGPPNPPYVGPLIAAAALGLPIQMVSGYANSADVRLAFDSGEIDAVSMSLDAYHTSFQSSDARAVLRFSATPIPEMDAPDAMSFASDARSRELLDTGIYMMAPLVRFYVVPRGVPAAKLTLLREALQKTFKDTDFLADARAAGLTIDPVDAATLQQTMATLAGRPKTIDALKSILQPH